MVPSPRDVPTYDHKPAMSAVEAAEAFVAAWNEDGPRFAIINFANADMVGHTGFDPGCDGGDRDGRSRAWGKSSRRSTPAAAPAS